MEFYVILWLFDVVIQIIFILHTFFVYVTFFALKSAGHQPLNGP